MRIEQNISDTKKIVCRACDLTEKINGDLNSHLHEGFTIGRRGKIMFWYFIWHSTGNASVVTSEIPGKKRFIRGDQTITIHLKN